MKPDAPVSRKIRCYPSAFCCPKKKCGGAPMVVVEQRLYAQARGGSRRFYVVCPVCTHGFRVVARFVEENVALALPEGAHIFQIDPRFDDRDEDIQEAIERDEREYFQRGPRVHITDHEAPKKRKKGRREKR